MPKLYTFLFFISLLIQTNAQTDSLHYPLNIPLYLSGTFGELRTNHFHSGLDIKTNGEEGLPVFAVDEGYIYRIKITRNGYGKALYIKHPSGLVSVYGHLKYFNDRIESYIKQKQYKKKSFEIEVFPYKIELPVKKGEIIAYSGNTGGSSGAHLHFELRNMKEHPLNPMTYGIKIIDHKKPIVKNVFAYPLDSLSHINQLGKRVKLNLKRLNDSLYITDTILAYGKIGIGLEAYDLQDFSRNHNGLYKVEVLVNGLKIYEHVMEEFSFFRSHYINTLIDYPYYKKYRRRIQQLWVKPYNLLEIYTQLVQNGIIKIENKKNYQIELVLSDFDQNKTHVKIPVNGYQTKNIQEPERLKKTPFPIKVDKNNVISFYDWILNFPPKTTYTDQYLLLKKQNKAIYINNNGQALHKSYIIKHPLHKVAKKQRPYAYLALLGKKRKAYYIYQTKKNDTITAYTKKFGYFSMRYDSIAPSIKPLNFKEKADLSNYRYLKFKIRDKQTGIKSYEGYIDNQWILLEYDYKTGILTYDFSDLKLSGSKHLIKLIITDNLNNKRYYQSVFYRKDKT